ncbi:MAG: lysine--tRNA ligase [Candidatus Fermentibacteraceae bacterium]|nr:lysine--tRNA ligase [Candidatus Fermentibacteraceae bacterium]MBN2609046.1 lysine--tRNA ligase [Candidatus Fermentibacteraceae bacterium]
MVNEQSDIRREKLQRITELGIDPYPPRCADALPIAGIREVGETEESVTVSGRLTARREHGKTVFADLRDTTGSIQVYLGMKTLSDTEWTLLGLLDLGDMVQVSGPVFVTRTGELTVKCQELTLLCKSLRQLPVVKVDSQGVVHDEVTDRDYLYRHRCVDLQVNHDSMERFGRRSRIITSMRSYLDERGFLEVETPILQPIYGGAAADPFETMYGSMDQKFYLRIATELYLKRLVAGGMERVYEIGKDFRNEGVDRTHSPEFTQLELYEAYADYAVMMDRFEEMVAGAAEAAGTGTDITVDGTLLSLRPPFQRIGFMDSLRKASGEDLFSWEPAELEALMEEKGIACETPDRITMLDKLFDHFVAHRIIGPAFVVDYPVELSPLAKRKQGDPAVTERFEAFIAGLELANAFSEQNNPLLQREILEEQARFSAHREGTLDEDFLYALEVGMPPTGGMGIGVDRLVMVLTDTARIRDTILFPHLRRVDQ